MVRYAWASDIHLDFLNGDNQRLINFASELTKGSPTGILLTGDISTAKHIIYHLSALEKVVQRPIYFVLGNHDYYGADIENVRKAMRELTNVSPFLRYMPTMPYHVLTPTTALVGHDGWYDALYGDWQGSNFAMTDWSAIHDFAMVRNVKPSIVSIARKLAHEAVNHVHNGIKQAVRYHSNIIVMTHFPPFQEAHVHLGKQGDAYAQPWFTSKMMGDMLLDAARTLPHITFTVLAGHTHGKATYQPMPNLRVHVAGAEYYQPAPQEQIEVT